jgi:hypothetical protein
VAGFCEHSDEPEVIMKGGVFLGLTDTRFSGNALHGAVNFVVVFYFVVFIS